MPENEFVFDIFCKLEKQWVWVATFDRAVRVGLNLPAVESYLNLMKIEDTETVCEALLIMQDAALEVWNGRK